MNNSVHKYFLSVLETYTEIPSSEWKKIADSIKLLHLDKNEFFIMQGDKPDRLAFITSGIFRVFCITESGDEKTLSFRTKGQFLAAYTPFLENRDTWYSIQALEDSELIYMFFDDFMKLSMGHSCWEKVSKEYIVQLFIEKENRERSFLTEDAKTRYLGFKKQYPELEQQIHNFYIASYLGISPVTLSRIRSDLKKTSQLT